MEGDRPSTLLDRYVAAGRGETTWEVRASLPGGGVALRLRSQTWRGIRWEHRLRALPPPAGGRAGVVWLHITGSGDGELDWMVLTALSARAGCAVAMLQDVPNQPLFGELTEDTLIAHTFAQYLASGEPDWPLLLPMTRAAVAAMDALQDWAARGQGVPSPSFIVSGASKRGWTTYLTAAVDRRVIGLAPLVYDNLRLEVQLARQRDVFGEALSPEIADYVRAGVVAQATSVRGRELLAAVDPWTYRERLRQPKMLLLGTNDPYWPVDALGLYRDDLRGPTGVAYFPNAGHGLGDPTRVLLSLLALYRGTVDGLPLPQVRVETTRQGGGWTVCAEAGPLPVRLWHARSSSQDFRQAVWGMHPASAGPSLEIPVAAEPHAWQAVFAEALVPFEGQELGLDTPVRVLPPQDPGS